MDASTPELMPLSGVTVLDFSSLVPGPLATLLLAAAGAAVTKVENPAGGDALRARPRSFDMLNRGKASTAADLKSPDQVARLAPLLRSCDVLVEQFRPGVMDRLGLGYDAVRAVNPRVIYCSITGYGQSGPRRGRAGHDLNYLGHSGALELVRHDGVPGSALPPALLADVGAGSYPAVINILLALLKRERTGHGCHLDIAIANNIFPFIFWALAEAGSDPLAPGAGRLAGGSPRYQTFRTSDGRTALVAPLEQKFWNAFCEVIGLDEQLRDDAGDPQATIAAVAAIIESRPSSYWSAVFEEADCCCSIAATVEEAMTDPAFRARGLFTAASGLPHPGPAALPLPLDRSLARTLTDPAPDLLPAPPDGTASGRESLTSCPLL